METKSARKKRRQKKDKCKNIIREKYVKYVTSNLYHNKYKQI